MVTEKNTTIAGGCLPSSLILSCYCECGDCRMKIGVIEDSRHLTCHLSRLNQSVLTTIRVISATHYTTMTLLSVGSSPTLVSCPVIMHAPCSFVIIFSFILTAYRWSPNRIFVDDINKIKAAESKLQYIHFRTSLTPSPTTSTPVPCMEMNTP